MRRRQAPPFHVGADGAQDGGDGGADVGADGQGQRVLVGDLPRRQGGDDQHQGSVAGLHHHRGEDADEGIEQQAEQAGHGELGKVDGRLERLEPLFHVMDAEEQETQAAQHIADALQDLGRLEQENHAEHQHRHGIGGDVHLEAEAGHQPGTGGGAQVGAEDDADALAQPDQPGAEEGDGDDRNQRTGLHHRGGDNPECQAFPEPVGGYPQQFLQHAAGEGLEAFFQRDHAKQEDGDAGGYFLEIRADPEPPGEHQENTGEEDAPEHGQHAQGSIMPRMVKNRMAAMSAETGTVISHAPTMRIRAERLTSSWR